MSNKLKQEVLSVKEYIKQHLFVSFAKSELTNDTSSCFSGNVNDIFDKFMSYCNFFKINCCLNICLIKI